LIVSGFVTSPELQPRILLSKEARLISIASKLLMSIKLCPY